jgi:hypothetical protein
MRLIRQPRAFPQYLRDTTFGSDSRMQVLTGAFLYIQPAGDIGRASEDDVSTESEIEELATNLMGNRESARRWLQTPNRYLGGKSPRDVLDTDEGRQLVEESLYTLEYGGL